MAGPGTRRRGGSLSDTSVTCRGSGAATDTAVTAPVAHARRPGGLSPRELQVLAELTTGRTNREIAERLYITPRTVGTHIEHILAKLGLPNRAAAAARAAAWGITPSD
ncbi:hypothetical protein QR97_26225 [Streptomyces sp. PBH53]|nr:hypothetical protein QR97_26225 [Streptomyces sp. PBH53]